MPQCCHFCFPHWFQLNFRNCSQRKDNANQNRVKKKIYKTSDLGGPQLGGSVNIIHISHGFEGDIPEYQPRGDTKAVMSPDAEGRHVIYVMHQEIFFAFLSK